MNGVIINATNIGRRLNGIGVYTSSLLREFSKLNTGIEFVVFLNKQCKEHIKSVIFPENFSIRWVAPPISPDYGFRGHFLRLLYSNLLSLRFRKYFIFNTSQLEAWFFRSAQIITIHDAVPLLFKRGHKKQYFFYKYLLKYALNRARRVITPSEYTRECLTTFYKLSQDKFRVVHNGIQEIYLKEAEKTHAKREKFILYSGRIAPAKNIAGLFKAFELIKDKIDCRLVIAGGGKDIHTHSDRVILKGYVSDDELFYLYKKASLFVFPSFYEGFGLPPLEAMACGCPVVVSNVASLPEVCGNAAYYVDPYDVESIAEGIYRVLTDVSLRQSLIKKGLERAKLFSWERAAKEHIKVFEEVLNS